jgi:hypothetical protein
VLNRLKQGLAMYPGAEKTPDDGLVAQLKEFYRADELWAVVTDVGPKRRGWTRVELEIHHEGLVYPNESYTQIPRGATLSVGDHVAIAPLRQMTRSEAFGLPGRAVKEAAVDEAGFALLPSWIPGPSMFTHPIPRNGKMADWKINWGVEPQYGTPQPDQGAMQAEAIVEARAAMPAPAEELERRVAAGAMTAAEADQTTAYLEGRATAEQLHDSGAMSDANYEQVRRVRQEAIGRFAALRDSGTLSQDQYDAAVASLG